MSYMIFKCAPLIERSFLQKLFKQHPVENAVIELNNLLSERPIRDVTHKDISEIENAYDVDLLSGFPLNLQEFYAVYLNFCLEDNELDDNEIEDLNHLSSILRLDKSIIHRLNESVGSIAYRRAWEEATSNGILSDVEERKLKKLSLALKLPSKMTEEIAYDVASKYIEQYIQEITDKLEYTEEDEAKLHKIAHDFKVELKLSSDTKNKFKKLSRYFECENSNLKAIEVEAKLQKNEFCYYVVESAIWYEFKYTKPYPDTLIPERCIKQTKKLHVLNKPNSGNKTSELKHIDSGTLYFTNKRVLMIGRVKNSNIRLEKIRDVVGHLDGIELNKDTGKPVYLNFTKDSDIACIILTKILNC